MLKKFQTYASIHEEQILTEALNNPQEYYMTDDTKMPGKCYGAFDVNGGNYIISLESSKDKGVYILEVGKTGAKGGKTLWWKFHDAKDILPVLATTMHFLQGTLPFLPQMKGVAVQFKQGASDQMKRATRIAEKVIKKSFIKSFKVIPVEQPPVTDKDKFYYQKTRFLFIARKEVAPKALFAGSTFKKYAFDGQSKDSVSADAVFELTPKTTKKQSNTLNPSTKYSFGQYDVETPIDAETIDKVKNITVVNNEKILKSANAAQDIMDQAFKTPLTGESKIAVVLKGIPQFSKMVKALEKNGYDEDKVNFENLKFVYSGLTSAQKNLITKVQQHTSLEGIDLSKPQIYQAAWKKILKRASEPNGVVQKDFTKLIKQYVSITNKDVGSVVATTQKADNISMEDFKPTLPGSGNGQVKMGHTFFEPDSSYDKNVMLNHLSDSKGLGYYDHLESLSELNTAVSYSGNQYSTYNDPLRTVVGKFLRKEPITKEEANAITKATMKISKMAKLFKKVKPLPESMYVYRSLVVLNEIRGAVKPGYEYLDPAFLSTSLKPAISLGGMDRMRIFLPKGSMVLPILYHSQHDQEMEVILPPSSVIKTIEVTRNEDRMFIQGVFVGSAHFSFVDTLKKVLTEEVNRSKVLLSFKRMINMAEEKKEEGYDPDGKYGGVYDWQIADLMTKAIKRGEFELDAPVDPSKED